MKTIGCSVNFQHITTALTAIMKNSKNDKNFMQFIFYFHNFYEIIKTLIIDVSYRITAKKGIGLSMKVFINKINKPKTKFKV